MLFARTACAVGAQAIVAVIFALRSSPTPWRDSESWLPVYGTLIDAGCLALLWHLTRREGIRLFDLVGFERTHVVRDVLLGLALIPVGLAFIFAGVYAAGWPLYGTLAAPYLFGPLPLPAALYGVMVWPFVWGITEQMTYNGYLVPRFQVLGSTGLAIVCVAFVWSLQHAFMPLTFDARFMVFRLLSPLPFSGTSVSRDFAEMPSQFNEHWAHEPSVFARYARHHKTGEQMPAALKDRLDRAILFNGGYALAEMLAACFLDMDWHMLPTTQIPEQVDAFEEEVLA